jgi:hypothetical protein
MARIGSVAAAPFVGDQFASLYLGAERVPTVPGKPAITSASYIPAGPATVIAFTAPNDGGCPITAYKVYADGVEVKTVLPAVPLQAAFGFEDLTGQSIEVSAVNAIGEGPKSAPVTVT